MAHAPPFAPMGHAKCARALPQHAGRPHEPLALAGSSATSSSVVCVVVRRTIRRAQCDAALALALALAAATLVVHAPIIARLATHLGLRAAHALPATRPCERYRQSAESPSQSAGSISHQSALAVSTGTSSTGTSEQHSAEAAASRSCSLQKQQPAQASASTSNSQHKQQPACVSVTYRVGKHGVAPK